MVDLWLPDLRYGARLLRRNPLFTLTAAASLAIGIGANTTIFTVASALLFRTPVGVVAPGRIVDVGRSQDGRGFDNGSYPNYLDVRARSTTIDGLYAYKLGAEPMSLGGSDGAERIFGDLVSINYFSVLGTRAYLGRLFTPGDGEQPGQTPLTVLSYGFWIRRFSADPSVIGRTLQLNGHPFTVIGVAPDGFHGTTVLTTDLWVPLTMVGELSSRRTASILTSRESVWLVMGGRLKPGATITRTQAELAGIAQALEREFPEANRGKGLRVVASSPIPGNTGPIAAFMSVLAGIVALVLAIACANVTGVLLARAAGRRREIAVRLAIGASRARLIRQMLVESVMLFLIGGALGLALARAMTTALVSLLPTLPVPLDVSLPLDARALSFTLGLSLCAAVLSGLVPAFHASRAEVIGGLKTDAQGGPDRLRLRNAFVVGQVALSIVLVIGAGLFVRGLQRAAAIDPGFEVRGVELAALDLSLAGYAEASGRAFTRELIARVRELPGVESAALAAMVPLGGSGMGLGGLTAPGVEPPAGRRSLEADWNVISPGYFQAMKMALATGRDFTEADRYGAEPVAIVNETAARRWWGTTEAIGKALVYHEGRIGSGERTQTMTVVAVARDAKYRDLGEEPRAFIFVPEQQHYVPRTTIVARSASGQRLAAELRRLLARLNPNLPITQSQTFEDYAALTLVPQRVAASVSAILGVVGLLLAAVGIYGVTAYIVASRTREIGIRMALGAEPRVVMRMVLRQGLALTLGGAAIGVLLAAGAGQLVKSQLFGVNALDPLAFGGSAVLFAAIGLAACYAPARRATEIEAIEALRQE